MKIGTDIKGIDSVPAKYRPLYLRAKTGRAAAIKVKCCECMAWDHRAIPFCPEDKCPLYALRYGAGRQG